MRLDSELFPQELPDILLPPQILQIQQHMVQVLLLHRIVCSKSLLRKGVVGMQPEGQRSRVQIHSPTQVPAQQVQILYELVDLLILDDYSVAILLCEDMLDFSFGVDQFQNDFGILGNGSCPNNWLALLFEVVDKVVKIFPFVNTQQGVKLVELFVEIVGSEGGQQIAFLIWSKRIDEELIHFHDDGEFAVVVFRGEEFVFGLIGLQNVFDKMSEVVFGLQFLLEEFEFRLFFFPKGGFEGELNMGIEKGFGFADHFC